MQPNRMSGYKYRALLLALLLMLVAYPVLWGPAGSPVLAKVLITTIFLAGGWVVFTHPRLRVLAALLGVPAVAGVWTGFVVPDRHVATATSFFHLSSALFEVFVFAVLLQGIHREKTVSVDTVAAALCGYMLIGVAFGHLHSFATSQIPGSFGGLPAGTGEYETHFLLTYFSFITLTTVGYGDITPARDTARALAMLEAVIGQFYLAVLVADLVGKRIAQALAGAPSPPG